MVPLKQGSSKAIFQKVNDFRHAKHRAPTLGQVRRMIQSPDSGNSSEFFKKAGSVFTSFNHEAGQVGDMDVDEMDMIYNKIDKLVREVDARQ